MNKKTFLVSFILIISLNQAFSQVKKDTSLYCMAADDLLARSKETASFFIMVMPYDTVRKLYPVEEFTPDGAKTLIGFSDTAGYKPRFEGTVLTYYPNGTRKEISNYHKGQLYGETFSYFPNKKLYNEVIYDTTKLLKLVECHDTTGTITAQNGNGKWIEYDFEYKNINCAGNVKDSLNEGTWQSFYNGKLIAESNFEAGRFKSGIFYTAYKKKVAISPGNIKPEFYGGEVGFIGFLQRTIHFPAPDREKGTQGKVIVTFVIERDGSLSHITALRGPTETMMQACVDAIVQSPNWMPGFQNGQPVRVQFTIPFTFNLADSN